MNITVLIAVLSLTFALLVSTLVQLRRLQKILKRARIERSLYFNRSSEFILILDESLKVLKVSQSILQLLNLQSEELLDKPIENTPLWPESVHDQSEALKTFRKVLSGKQGEPSLFTFNRRDNKNRIFSMRINVISIPASSGRKQDIVCLAQDSTAEIETKQKLHKRILVENLIEEISASTLTASSLRECVPGILKSAAYLLDANGAFFIHTDINNNILWKSFWSDSEITSGKDLWKDFKEASVLPFIDSSGFISIRNLKSNPDIPESFRQQAQLQGAESLISTILQIDDGEKYGYAGFSFSSPVPPGDESSQLLLRLLKTTLSGLLHKIKAQRDMELFRQSVDAAGQGIVLVDNNGLIVYTNRAYSNLTGKSAASSHHVWNAYPDSFADKVKLLIFPLVKSGEQWTGELQIIRNDGTRIDTIETFHPISTGAGNIRYIVNIITDISRQKRLEEQLILARDEANTANRLKSDYLTSMSHEIRNPMNAVIGLTYLTLQTKLDKSQKEYLKKANTAAKSLLKLINDIMDLSKIEAGFLKLELQPFSIDELLDNLADLITDKAWEKGLKLLFSRSLKTPEYWIGDSFRLSQVLLNLVGNAVKFTQEGLITLNVHSENLQTLSFTVIDTGIGMTKEQADQMLNPFTQADTSTSRKFGGSGLGLNISKQIVELMGGKIEIKSEPEKGSQFSFTIPLKISTDKEKEPLFNNKTAVVISGTPATGDYHQQSLQALGMKVISFRSIKEALENPEEPNITLFDTDGFQDKVRDAAYILSNGNNDNNTLLLSGNCASAELSRLTPGISAITLPIPYSIRRLRTALNSPVDEETEIDSLHSTIVQGRVLLADDNEINQLVGKDLIQTTGLMVDTVTSGRDAVNACETGKYNMVFMDLHMPGMSGYKAASLIHQNHPDIPVIAMTASYLNDIKTNFNDAGFSRYIAKPIEPEKLFELISEILGIPVGTLKTGRLMKKTPISDNLKIEGVDTDIGLHHILGDRRKYKTILSQFVESHSSFSNGIQTALESHNIPEAISLIHSLRGAAGYIGATVLKEHAAIIEKKLQQGILPDNNSRQILLSAINSLIENITTTLNIEDDNIRITVFNELEIRIRNSDETIPEYIEEHIGFFARRTDLSHIDRIRKSMEHWDYDTALETLEDWRESFS